MASSNFRSVPLREMPMSPPVSARFALPISPKAPLPGNNDGLRRCGIIVRLIARAILSVAAFLTVGCSTLTRETADSAVSDIDLWQRSVFDGVRNELVCRGMSPEAAGTWYTAKFRKRDQRVAEAIEARYEKIELQEIILTGLPCPRYRGAVRAHEKHLRILEARLGLQSR